MKKLVILAALVAMSSSAIAGSKSKFFIDTHDRAKGSFPEQQISAQDFINKFAEFDEEALDNYMGAHTAHVNVAEGKAYCFTRAKDIETIRRVHEAVGLPYDSIIEVRTVSASDLRP